MINLITNHHFVQGLEDWKLVKMTGDSSANVVTKDGLSALELHNKDKRAWTAVGQEIKSKLIEGNSYSFSIWYNTVDVQEVGFRFGDVSLAMKSKGINEKGDNNKEWMTNLAKNSWHVHSTIFTVTASYPGSDYPYFGVYLDYNCIGTLYIRDIQVYDVSSEVNSKKSVVKALESSIKNLKDTIKTLESDVNSRKGLINKLELDANLNKNIIEKLEAHKQGLYIAKVGHVDKIVIEKNAQIDLGTTGITEVSGCKSIILGFTPKSNDKIEDIIDLSQFGISDKRKEISFETIKGNGDTAISAIKLKGQSDYIACVYNFDADSFVFEDKQAKDLVMGVTTSNAGFYPQNDEL